MKIRGGGIMAILVLIIVLMGFGLLSAGIIAGTIALAEMGEVQKQEKEK